MNSSVITTALIGVVIVVAMSILNKAAGKKVHPAADGSYSLRMNLFYGVLGFISVLIGLVFLVVIPVVVDAVDINAIGGIALMLLVFWGAGIPCLLYYWNHRLTFNDLTIHVTNVYGRKRLINWNEIIDIRFSGMSGLLTIEDKTTKVKIHQHVVGLSVFMKAVESKTRWTAKELKVPAPINPDK